jgi:GMP synthase PP-ATPase subunit
MGLKDFFIRKMIENKMKDVPKDQQEMIMGAINKNPEFFSKIAGEIEAETKKGKDQMQAAIEVMKRHQHELQQILKK